MPTAFRVRLLACTMALAACAPIVRGDEALFPPGAAKYFSGTVGTSRVQVRLRRTGDALAGSYVYDRVARPLALAGTLTRDGAVTLDERDPAGHVTGRFAGSLARAEGDPDWIVLAGRWSKAGGGSVAFALEEQPISISGEVFIVTKQMARTTGRTRVTVELPQVVGSETPRFAKFNAGAAAALDHAIDRAVAELGRRGGELTGSYDVALATNAIVSVVISCEVDAEGAAHPGHFTLTYNFDVGSGRALALADLFTAGAPYLRAISEASIADLETQLDAPDKELLAEGAGPTAENFRAWSVTPSGLAITFDEYQVASYAEGPHTVVIPYAMLAPIADPHGPLASVRLLQATPPTGR